MYSFCSNTALKKPQRRSESGASGSSSCDRQARVRLRDRDEERRRRRSVRDSVRPRALARARSCALRRCSSRTLDVARAIRLDGSVRAPSRSRIDEAVRGELRARPTSANAARHEVAGARRVAVTVGTSSS